MAGHVELFNLTKIYDPTRNKVAVVREFNLDMAEGEFVALIGHSGCGKSTVLTMVAGLNDVTDGAIVVAKREIRGPGPDRGVVFQSPSLLPWMNAFENVMLGVERVFPHGSKAERADIVAYYLAIVGLGDSMKKFPRELSEGMQQRVGIARAFALKPKMLLLDEPFGKLDSLTRMELQDVLLGLLEQNRITTMMVTHDVDEALLLSDRIVMMTNGPEARVGETLVMPFERPRVRSTVLAHKSYYELRGAMLGFLADQDRRHHRPREADSATAPASVPEVA
ncbi:MAG: Bacitracin transporter ATP-binding protein [Myxococcaceae bacterium]|nr:Bacitracin transporter ATP-binding protein [Myxococcaceae bacterium]